MTKESVYCERKEVEKLYMKCGRIYMGVSDLKIEPVRMPRGVCPFCSGVYGKRADEYDYGGMVKGTSTQLRALRAVTSHE